MVLPTEVPGLYGSFAVDLHKESARALYLLQTLKGAMLLLILALWIPGNNIRDSG